MSELAVDRLSKIWQMLHEAVIRAAAVQAWGSACAQANPLAQAH